MSMNILIRKDKKIATSMWRHARYACVALEDKVTIVKKSDSFPCPGSKCAWIDDYKTHGMKELQGILRICLEV